ncbi:hypothetical protein AMJ40_02660 [candidate division TA06 bacterium DG_26]|uniref:UVR domain-containing protein n=1 Tax=candidate division TA06 bacterium DG_26 TaxID=1703771 RepID=A0A0S7WLP3_UNCT6|nr:MAG: hypothetical protein AMJ40_02660 [candidate division TA06 bacterium DG_26]
MLCEDCGKREATLQYTEVSGDKETVYHLCEECAQQRGYVKPKSSPTEYYLEFGLGGELTKEEEKLRCNCGLTFADFRGTGRLGCVNCYVTFSEQLKSLMQRIHGATKHVGKVVTKDGEYLRLKRRTIKLEEQLKKAVAQENFEAAADLRDQIRELNKLKSKKRKPRD